MKTFKLKQETRFNKFGWLMTPLLLLAFFAAGGVSLFMAHAASPLDGRYAFRAVTSTGQYITGQMEFRVTSGTDVDGGICSLSYAPSHCTIMRGTTDSVHVNLTVNHIAGKPDMKLLGTFQSTASKHGGYAGFFGTLTFGSASGHWEARKEADVDVSGSYKLYALTTSGPSKGQMIHGILNIVEQSNDQLTGTFCSTQGPCEIANGSNYTDGGYLYIYLSITKGTQSNLQLRGTLSGVHRMDGQFQIPNSSGKLIERGYWLAH